MSSPDSFSQPRKARLYPIEELSGPDEFGSQYRQSDRDNNNCRPRQCDHGHSGRQDREADHYYDQPFSLANLSDDEMFQAISPIQVQPRRRKNINKSGIGIPSSQSKIQPIVPVSRLRILFILSM